MGATVFVQPLDLVKNRMQLSGAGAKGREYRTSLHALGSILRHEGLRGIYTGYGAPQNPPEPPNPSRPHIPACPGLSPMLQEGAGHLRGTQTTQTHRTPSTCKP